MKNSSADMEVSTYDGLPTCAEKREGKTAYVKDQDQGYVCKAGKWVEDDGAVKIYSSERKLSFSSSSSEKNGSSNKNIDYGEFTDERDGQVYKTVKIGDQVWMAQNLNYDYNEGTAKCYCYNNSVDSCTKYGRLYTWAAARDSVGAWDRRFKGCGYGTTCRNSRAYGVCPKGWHLPSKSEWDTLIDTVGGWYTAAGSMLKSTSGWSDNGNGTDAYGFAALPAGHRQNNYSNFFGVGERAFFWSSTESNSYEAYGMLLGDSHEVRELYDYDKRDALSVRCVKD